MFHLCSLWILELTGWAPFLAGIIGNRVYVQFQHERGYNQHWLWLRISACTCSWENRLKWCVVCISRRENEPSSDIPLVRWSEPCEKRLQIWFWVTAWWVRTGYQEQDVIYLQKEATLWNGSSTWSVFLAVWAFLHSPGCRLLGTCIEYCSDPTLDSNTCWLRWDFWMEYCKWKVSCQWKELRLKMMMTMKNFLQLAHTLDTKCLSQQHTTLEVTPQVMLIMHYCFSQYRCLTILGPWPAFEFGWPTCAGKSVK